MSATITLAQGVQALLEERRTIVARLVEIDGEIASVCDALASALGTPSTRQTPAPLGPPVGARPPRRPTPRAGMTSPASPAVVQARDAAILAALKHGPKSTAALFEVMPTEQGQVLNQRMDACHNALTRLRVKQQIRQTSKGEWELA